MSGNFFTAQSVRFFAELSLHNNKQWFEEHRPDFEEYILTPAMHFVDVIGSTLRKTIAPNLNAIPKIDKSIFRLHRDVRFSKEKSPYKTHLGIFMWEGEGKKLECPGFYFQLSAESFMIAGGLHIFTPQLLGLYREAALDEITGPALEKATAAVLQKEPSFRMQEKRYKKVPRGFDAGHPQAGWLLYDGLAFMAEEPVGPQLYSSGFDEYVIRKFSALEPVHHWLLNMTRSDRY